MGRFDWLVTVQGPAAGGPQKALYCAAVPDALEEVSAGTQKAFFVLLEISVVFDIAAVWEAELLQGGWGENASEHPGS